MAYQERTLAGVLTAAARSFAAVVVTGPRQSGKTTLVRQLFDATHAYCSLDDPAVREQAQRDPGLLLVRFPPPVILDEIQYAPELLHHVKLAIDAHRQQRGRYVITGSQLFPLMQGVGESLAGRAAVTSLLSFSLREALGQADLNMQTYLERDVRSLRGVGALGDFQRQVFALAARTGSLINFEDLARDLRITGKTVKAWVSVLEASGQVLTLQPYHINLGKRLVKRPKIYFLDTGTLAFLLGITHVEQLLSGPSAGPLFEAAVLGQLHRLFLHRGEPSRLYFWRTAAGHEVDFVIEHGQRLIPIEAKLTANPSPRDAAPVEEFQALFGKRAAKGYVVSLCRERFPLTRTVDALPLGSF